MQKHGFPDPSSRNLNLEERPTEVLVPYANNARTHPRTQIKKIAKSLNERGWTNPILIDRSNNVVCGHGRLEAAKLLGMKTIPVLVLENLSDADRRAYIIADNALAERSGWSKKMLRTELQGLVEIGYDIELTGFDTLQIDTLLSIDHDEDPGLNDIVALPSKEKPVSRVGDMWTIGKHRLVVGDARDPAVIERLMDMRRAQLVVTDPPYGCHIKNFVSGTHDDFVMGAGEVSLPELGMTILRPAFRNIAAHCEPGAIAFIFSDWRAANHMVDAANGVFEENKNWIIWVKTNASMGTFYRSQFEIVLAFKVSPGHVINNFGLGEGGRHRSNVWTYAGANTFLAGRKDDLVSHPTCKPIKLLADAILDCSKPGGIVLDVFAGSGTTLAACQRTGRIGYGIELDPKYADVILARVSKEVGEPALLDGLTKFDDVAAERRKA
jgi:DNA modification methylase